ncbi:MAG: HNH endonuclease [Gemmataceae bacterium]|nr:HNH endonuclease [Gemmataceae bacterium]
MFARRKSSTPEADMEKASVGRVWSRALSRCEYCLMPQEGDDAPFEIDHVIAKKHGGKTTSNNLALSCFYCNSFKGPNIAGFDRKRMCVVPLFDPRQQKWVRHFRWRNGVLIGRTSVRRVTVDVLNINDALRVELRRQLAREGLL